MESASGNAKINAMTELLKTLVTARQETSQQMRMHGQMMNGKNMMSRMMQQMMGGMGSSR